MVLLPGTIRFEACEQGSVAYIAVALHDDGGSRDETPTSSPQP